MPYERPLRLPKLLILSPQQLTGRVRTHVMELSEPRCTLHPAAAAAFVALRSEAAKSGIDLMPASTFRDFERQLTIWNQKYYGNRPLLDAAGRVLDPKRLNDEQIVEAILLWSALPGASRHHWGTEIDIIDRAALAAGQQPQMVPPEYGNGGIFERLGRWIPQHCADFGFFLPYDLDRGGVQPEPWHLSYAPVSTPALAQLTVEVLQAALGGVEIAGAAVVCRQLRSIHARYVAKVAQPSAVALAAAAHFSPAARPS
jgi:LAS superfamily LD-carboxypeptidase LdcB